MSVHTEFDYESFVEQKLESDPVGRTESELAGMLPDGAGSDELEETLQDLSESGVVKQIGEKWRWMDF